MYEYDEEFIEKYKNPKLEQPILSLILSMSRAGLFNITTRKGVKHIIFIVFRDLWHLGFPLITIKSTLKEIWKNNIKEHFSWEVVNAYYEELKQLQLEEKIFDEMIDEELYLTLTGFPIREVESVKILNDNENNADEVTYTFKLNNNTTFTMKKDELMQPNKFIDNWLASFKENPFLKPKELLKNKFIDNYFKFISYLLKNKSVEVVSGYSKDDWIINKIINIFKKFRYYKKEDITSNKQPIISKDNEKIYIPLDLLFDVIEKEKLEISSRKLFYLLSKKYKLKSAKKKVFGDVKTYWQFNKDELFNGEEIYIHSTEIEEIEDVNKNKIGGK